MFRNLLIADLVSDIGTFMQGVGAAWLMVSEGAGPLLVALTQTASALPFFLLALPAGALGDIFDRRKLIIATEVWMASVAAAIAALTLLHLITPWMLLLLTLALSIGDALEAPTWRAILPEVVPPKTCSRPSHRTALNLIWRARLGRRWGDFSLQPQASARPLL
jgi:MFS family permease